MKKLGKEEYCYFNEFINNSGYILTSAEVLKETVQNYSGCWNGSGDNAGPNC